MLIYAFSLVSYARICSQQLSVTFVMPSPFSLPPGFPEFLYDIGPMDIELVRVFLSRSLAVHGH